MELDEFPSFEVAADDAHEIAADIEAHPAYHDVLPKGFFRLLRILPGDPESEICCEIGQYAFDGEIPYTALSYVWGRGPDHHTIRLNGTRKYVRKNLWRFLRQARAIGSRLSGLWWIDALSINQLDFEEKTAQVSLMPQIYSRAGRVVVWLGPSYAHSDQAMRDLARPSSYWQVKRKRNKFWGNQSSLPLLNLCGRPYWTRLWVFQELHLARSVDLICGDCIVSLEQLRNFLDDQCNIATPTRTNEKFQNKIVSTSPARSMVGKLLRTSDADSLWNLMRATHHLNCADARDKVYALLGLVTAVADFNIDADYTMPIPTLLNVVLNRQHRLNAPASIAEVEQQCHELASLLGVPEETMFELNEQRGRIAVPAESDMISSKLGRPNGWITLWWTTFYGHQRIEDLLFEERHVQSEDLVLAVKTGNTAAVRVLLESRHLDAGWTKDERHESALDVAARSDNEEIVSLLLDAGGWKGPILPFVARTGNTALVKVLLADDRVDVNHQQGDGQTALHAAARRGDERVSKLLLNEGKANAHIKDSQGSTALHFAAICGKTSIIDELLNVGKADPDIVDRFGKKALTYAFNFGKPEAAKQLYEVTQTGFTWEQIETAFAMPPYQRGPRFLYFHVPSDKTTKAISTTLSR